MYICMYICMLYHLTPIFLEFPEDINKQTLQSRKTNLSQIDSCGFSQRPCKHNRAI